MLVLWNLPFIVILYGLFVIGCSVAFADQEYPIGNSVLFLIGLGILQFTHVINLLSVPSHIGLIAEQLGLYLLIGLAWCFIRWYFYTRKSARNVIMNINGNEWEDFNYLRAHELKNFEIKYNLGRLVNWGLYWPFSVLWTLLTDPLKELYEWLLTDVFGKLFTWIAAPAKERVEGHFDKLAAQRLRGKNSQ